ncbi:MAG: helix-turn-helix domain-containing protein [Rhodoplanes sp.]
MPLITASRAEGLTIGQLSKLTGVNIETIRYYEKIRVLPAPPRTEGGRRVFGPIEARTLAFIRRARQLGFTLEDTRALLDLGGPGQAACADVCSIANRHIADIRSKIADLRKLENLLSNTVAQCSGKAVPECAVLDALYPSEATVAPQ